jgi:hypothetical protein
MSQRPYSSSARLTNQVTKNAEQVRSCARAVHCLCSQAVETVSAATVAAAVLNTLSTVGTDGEQGTADNTRPGLSGWLLSYMCDLRYVTVDLTSIAARIHNS